jgi:hypothetical protein
MALGDAGLFDTKNLSRARATMAMEDDARGQLAYKQAMTEGINAARVARATENLKNLGRNVTTGLFGSDDPDGILTNDPRLIEGKSKDVFMAKMVKKYEKAAEDGSITTQEYQNLIGDFLQGGYTDEAKQLADIMKTQAEANTAGVKRPFKMTHLDEYIMPDGTILPGSVTADGLGNKVWTHEGIQRPVPKDAMPFSAVRKVAMNNVEFGKLKDEMTGNVQSLNKIIRYGKTVAKGKKGLAMLGDQFIGAFRTVAGKKVSPEQLAVMVQKGDLSGLVGRYRTEVVGGGVMTEADALKVLRALGGDVSAFRNPAVVGRAIKNLFNEKKQFLENNIQMYNIAARYPTRKMAGIKQIKIPEFNDKIFGELIKSGVKTSDGSQKKYKIIPDPNNPGSFITVLQ